jgi:hypothetical protein
MTDDQWLRDFVAQHSVNQRLDRQELVASVELLRLRRVALADLWDRMHRQLLDAVDTVNMYCDEQVMEQVRSADPLTWVCRWRRHDYRFSLRITDYAVKAHWGAAEHQPDSTASYAIHLDDGGTARLATHGEVVPDARIARQLLQPWLDGILTQSSIPHPSVDSA